MHTHAHTHINTVFNQIKFNHKEGKKSAKARTPRRAQEVYRSKQASLLTAKWSMICLLTLLQVVVVVRIAIAISLKSLAAPLPVLLAPTHSLSLSAPVLSVYLSSNCFFYIILTSWWARGSSDKCDMLWFFVDQSCSYSSHSSKPRRTFAPHLNSLPSLSSSRQTSQSLLCCRCLPLPPLHLTFLSLRPTM